jgi:hypothetical protein
VLLGAVEGQPEVSDLQDAVLKQDVLGLDVSTPAWNA